jgi:hypothetical protein
VTVEYSSDDASRAEQIASQLFEAEYLAEPQVIEVEPFMSIADVEEDARDFRQQIQTIETVGQRVPAERAGDDQLVPVDTRSLNLDIPTEPYGDSPAGPYRYERAYAALRDLYERRAPTIPTMSPNEARSAFRFRLVDFLATRLAGVRDFREGHGTAGGSQAVLLRLPPRLGAPSAPTAGATFSVATNSSGLRVHWSGYYWRSPTYFGAPTTPCSSVLQSGTYAFGVDGGAYKSLKWDRAKVTLPGVPSVHLNY